MTKAVRTRQDVLDVLRAHEAELRALGIEHLDLFGSFARDEAGPDSDVDLYAGVDHERAPSSWYRYEAEDRIELLLGRSVDFLTKIENQFLLRAVARDLTNVF